MSSTTQFADHLLDWHKSIDRNLPWKNDNDPYKIWLSEIIMQQTRVAQGTPYYLSFVNTFPTIVDLANAPEDRIMKLWQGLGYYSRARNLHHAAKTVRDQYNGKFPDKYEEILSLKGVGKYTAAAISSFAYGLEYPVVDGNVIRVLSRYFGITEAVDATPTLKEINRLAKKMISGSDPAAYNQAIMDFGALHCKPKSPNCETCVFSSECKAYQEDLVGVIPLKAKKIKKRIRYFHYLILKDPSNNTILKFRNEKDIWQSLYDFPNIENDNGNVLTSEMISAHLNQLNIEVVNINYPSQSIKHILTHQTLYGQFYEVAVNRIPEVQGPLVRISRVEMTDYALPVLLTKYLETSRKTPTLF